MINIAIDGPGGAGKSTVAKALAKKLGIMYLDTGAMYRAAALKAHINLINPKDITAVDSLVDYLDTDIKYLNGEQRVFLDGEDVSEKIREHFISAMASDISAIPSIRLKLVELQRSIANKYDCVLDGRDIGSFVLPQATLKIFLTADIKTRATRRANELTAKGNTVPFEQVLSDLEKRDKNDMTRAFSPLKKAADAITIDSTQMSVQDVVEKIEALLKQRLSEN